MVGCSEYEFEWMGKEAVAVCFKKRSQHLSRQPRQAEENHRIPSQDRQPNAVGCSS